MRAVRRRHGRAWRNSPAGFVVDAARGIAEHRALRWAAWELIRCHRAAFSSLDDKALARLAVGLDSWESVDAFGCTLSGPAWAQGLASDDLVHRWARSPDRWLRRTALVSTVALNRPADGGKVDAARTLAVCGRLVEDRDDMVVKALSWALRELGRHEPWAVRDFLSAHDTGLATRVKREVGNKLRTGLKNPRLG